ncbi:MAG TPA: methyltransferase domain-containing protein [Myxococcota bacterium]|nr:methyltransferase domain-containing protein [Myxococcota bacterium]
MDRRTRAIYEAHAEYWIAHRGVDAEARRQLRAFAARLAAGARVADLGCGPGWFARALAARGRTVLGLDLSRAMLREAVRAAPRARLVRGDLGRLPFARESLGGAWAKNTYIHLPFRELPSALADLARALRPGAPLAVSFLRPNAARQSARLARTGWAELRSRDEALAGRLFTLLGEQLARDLLAGAGFRGVRVRHGERLWLTALRARTLSDSVRPGLELLVVGLNPSPVAAATGVPFAGANNRFWPAALRAGWLARDRDPADALRRGIGFTDLAKRVTPSANALRPREYRAGAARVARLVRVLRPRAVAFVGLDGFRRAVDARARPGPVAAGFAGRPAYLVPSTSGRNAAVSLAALVRHFRAARRLARAR